MTITYDRKVFFDAVRDSVFRGWMSAKQVSGTEAILDAWEKLQPEGDTRFIAYILGTTKWETGSTMQPIAEIGHGRGRSYGAPAGPWHQVYYGRGDVQDTWYANYAKQQPKLLALGVLKPGESIIETPDLAMRPDVAAAIMFFGMLDGWFTGRKLSTYFTDKVSDWLNARRIINGIDHDEDLAALAKSFYAALIAARRGDTTGETPAAEQVEVPAPAGLVERIKPLAPASVVRVAAPARKTLLERIGFFFGRH